MRLFLGGILKTSVAIILTGFVLDEMGSGAWGASAQSIAKKVTRGYGV